MSRPKVDWRSSSISNYKSFCEKYPEQKISYEDWSKIIYAFSHMAVEHVLETGEKIKFPLGIGEFSINKIKRKTHKNFNGKQIVNLPIDWKKTKEKGKVIYNFNFHTEGYFFGWHWFKRSARFKNNEFVYFKPCRYASRLLSHYLKVDEKYEHIYPQWKF